VTPTTSLFSGLQSRVYPIFFSVFEHGFNIFDVKVDVLHFPLAHPNSMHFSSHVFSYIVVVGIGRVVVGIYTVEVVALFALLLNGIENGFDKVSRDHLIAQMVLRAIVIYGAVSILSVILFHGVILNIMQSTGMGT